MSKYQEVLEREKRTLRLKQKETLVAMNQLGLSLGSEGNYTEAAKPHR